MSSHSTPQRVSYSAQNDHPDVVRVIHDPCQMVIGRLVRKEYRASQTRRTQDVWWRVVRPGQNVHDSTLTRRSQRQMGAQVLLEDHACPMELPTEEKPAPTDQPAAQPRPDAQSSIRARRERMRDSRHLQGELVGVGELKDLHGRRFQPQYFRASWERQGGEEWPWELRVTVQGHSILADGREGAAVRSLVYEDDAAEVTAATFRAIPDWLVRELAPFAPSQDLWASLDAGSGEVRHATQGGPMPGLGTLHGFATSGE